MILITETTSLFARIVFLFLATSSISPVLAGNFIPKAQPSPSREWKPHKPSFPFLSWGITMNRETTQSIKSNFHLYNNHYSNALKIVVQSSKILAKYEGNQCNYVDRPQDVAEERQVLWKLIQSLDTLVRALQINLEKYSRFTGTPGLTREIGLRSTEINELHIHVLDIAAFLEETTILDNVCLSALEREVSRSARSVHAAEDFARHFENLVKYDAGLQARRAAQAAQGQAPELTPYDDELLTGSLIETAWSNIFWRMYRISGRVHKEKSISKTALRSEKLKNRTSRERFLPRGDEVRGERFQRYHFPPRYKRANRPGGTQEQPIELPSTPIPTISRHQPQKKEISLQEAYFGKS